MHPVTPQSITKKYQAQFHTFAGTYVGLTSILLQTTAYIKLNQEHPEVGFIPLATNLLNFGYNYFKSKK